MGVGGEVGWGGGPRWAGSGSLASSAGRANFERRESAGGARRAVDAAPVRPGRQGIPAQAHHAAGGAHKAGDLRGGLSQQLPQHRVHHLQPGRAPRRDARVGREVLLGAQACTLGSSTPGTGRCHPAKVLPGNNPAAQPKADTSASEGGKLAAVGHPRRDIGRGEAPYPAAARPAATPPLPASHPVVGVAQRHAKRRQRHPGRKSLEEICGGLGQAGDGRGGVHGAQDARDAGGNCRRGGRCQRRGARGPRHRAVAVRSTRTRRAAQGARRSGGVAPRVATPSPPGPPPEEPSVGGMLLWPPLPCTSMSQVSYPFSEVPTSAMGCREGAA